MLSAKYIKNIEGNDNCLNYQEGILFKVTFDNNYAKIHHPNGVHDYIDMMNFNRNFEFMEEGKETEGVLYIATGNSRHGTDYLQEAMESAKISKKFLQGRKMAIVTDNTKKASEFGVFDYVIPHDCPNYSYRDKIPPLLNLPFTKTLFLDTDARLVEPADVFFDTLNNSDVGIAHAPTRRPPGWWDSNAPELFPEFNTGVILLKRGLNQRKLIKNWLNKYDELDLINEIENKPFTDQASFRSALWNLKDKINLTLLPPESNLRTPKPWIAGLGIKVYVIHGRVPEKEWDKLLEYLNGNINKFRSSFEWDNIHKNIIK